MQSCLYRASWHNGGLLLPGEIDERSAFARELVVFYIANDSDNLSRLGLVGSVSLVTQQKLLADGVLVRKVTAGEGLANDDAPGCSLGVALLKDAATAEWNLQGVEESGADDVIADDRPVVLGGSGMAKDGEAGCVASVGWEQADDAGGGASRQRRDLVDKADIRGGHHGADS